MTSTFDHLGYLFYLAKDKPEYRELVLAIYDYAIAEINKVDRKILNWETWVEKHSLGFYTRLYGVELAELNQKAAFISDAHSDLDHTSQYHFKCVHNFLDIIIGKVTDWFFELPRRGTKVEFFGLDKLNKRFRDRYPKIFKLLKPKIEEIIDEESYYKRYLKKW